MFSGVFLSFVCLEVPLKNISDYAITGFSQNVARPRNVNSK